MLRRVLALQTDPYTVAPLWPDAVSIAGLQARFGLDAGKWTAEQMAQVALDSFAVAERSRLGEAGQTEHRRAAGPAVLRRSAAPPRHRADHRRRVGDRAGRGRQGPRAAREPGVDHRLRAPHRDAGARRPRPDHLAVDGGVGQGGDRWRRRLDRRRRTLRAVHPSAADPHRGHRAGRLDEDQPVRAARWPPTRCSRRAWSASASRPSTSSTARRSECWRTPPVALRCNRIWSRSWKADERLREGQGSRLMAKISPRFSAPGRRSTSPSARTSR